ncbi:MAG TPA: tyrosine-type recombinase/integrase [Actinomycetota bacterium]|nr:tyrosine-type recombinase/integrase [Actinomycetota bacterium]
MATIRILEASARRPRRFRVEWYTPEGAHRSRTFPTRRAAEAFLHEIESAKLRGTYRDPAAGRQRFGDYLERWLAEAVHLRPATRALYRRVADRHLIPGLGCRRLAELDRAACRSFLANLEAGPATVEVVHRLLRRVLEDAVRDGILERNPAARLGLRRPRPREARFLTPEEVAAIADEVPGRYRALVLLLAYGGLRIGEASALTIRRLDLPRRRVEVVESAAEVEGRWEVGETKTGKGRVVVLPASVAEELARHVERYTDGRPTSLVFTSEDGGPLRRGNFRARVFAPACRRAGISPSPRVHDLRHTAVALAIRAGAHPKAIQELAGHSSIKVTLDRYGHLFPSLAEDLADRLDSMARAAAERGRVVPFRAG